MCDPQADPDMTSDDSSDSVPLHSVDIAKDPALGQAGTIPLKSEQSGYDHGCEPRADASEPSAYLSRVGDDVLHFPEQFKNNKSGPLGKPNP
ncbi:hypothetical protein LA080_006310 [Diaporthe eres]|nr:hypothetical protein LA080_006310 [Diaporthe eres]